MRLQKVELDFLSTDASVHGS